MLLSFAMTGFSQYHFQNFVVGVPVKKACFENERLFPSARAVHLTSIRAPLIGSPFDVECKLKSIWSISLMRLKIHLPSLYSFEICSNTFIVGWEFNFFDK